MIQHDSHEKLPRVDGECRILDETIPTKQLPSHLRATTSRKHASSRVHRKRSIQVTNNFQDQDALFLLLQQHGRHLIEEMAFSMRPKAALGREPEPESTSGTTNKTLISRAARDLLSGSLTGPSLRRIDLECDFELQTEETTKFELEINRVFRQPREEEALLQLEAEDPQRRLLADAWASLSQDTVVRELSVDSLVPIWTSSFHSVAFRELLGRLETLDISIFGSKKGYRCINTVPSYVDSLQSILKVLFLHSGALTSLSLHASQQAPLGARGQYHIPLSLKATQLPGLRHLSLKNCFIGFELAHFINGHTHTLETLELHNCYGYRGMGDSDATSGMSWATFLALITRPGMKLQRFIIADRHIPLTADDERMVTYDVENADEPKDVRDVRRAQRKNPKLRLFLYGFLRDYSGELWMNKEAILASFDGEDDQRAFVRLMGVVVKNGQGPKGGEELAPDKTRPLHTVEVIELPA